MKSVGTDPAEKKTEEAILNQEVYFKWKFSKRHEEIQHLNCVITKEIFLLRLK